MADYKGIKGFKVQSLASDPSPGVVGQVWYNTASNALKYTTSVGAWSSGGDINTARAVLGGAGITQTAGLIFGGTPGPAPGTAVKITESYDGTTWTEVDDMTSGRSYIAGCGPQTAAITFGGSPAGSPTQVTTTEEYNGTSWTTSPASLNTDRHAFGACGTQTGALCIAGRTPTHVAVVEDFDGSTWTEVADLSSARRYVSSAPSGTPTAAIAVGGYVEPGGALAANESFNGTSWTELADLNTVRYWGGMGGNQTTAIYFAGAPTMPPGYYQTTTEYWDGSSWTEVADLGTGRYGPGFGGSSAGTDAFCAGGGPVAPVGVGSEEWTFAAATKTVTVS